MEELIWNALDAGGPRVDVRFELNELGAVEALEVEDQGTGIRIDELERAFGTIGKSLRLEQGVTIEGRALHGSEGRGRFRAFVLGSRTKWMTAFQEDGRLREYEITIRRDRQDRYTTSDPIDSSKARTGTTLRIEGVDEGQQSLPGERAADYLTQRLALYLKNYPGVTVVYDGKSLDPSPLIKHADSYELEAYGNGESRPDYLDVIEWNFQPPAKKLLICDDKGFAWFEMLAGVQAKDVYYTAFLRTPQARQWHEEGRFLLGELDEEVRSLVNRGKEKLREHLRRRLAEEAAELVDRWKEEQIYPYSEDEPDTPIRRAERQVFDIVASRVHLYHPSFRQDEVRSRQFTLRLVRQALESNPSSLRQILEEVLRLPKEQQDELADLFQRASLESMLAAAKDVENRLRAIAGFDHILFSADWKKTLLERTQLHRLLVHHLWIFGDEYALDTDDEPLRAVLQQHLKHLGRDELAPRVDVKLIDGKKGIPDLMISRRFKRDSKRMEHVVVELKRPADALGDAEISQIKKYAYAVADDERFSKEYTIWTFMLIGNDLDAFAEREAKSKGGLPYGCIAEDGNLSVWIKRWSDVLHEAKGRHSFFQERLELEASADEGLRYLQEHHSALLSGRGLTKKQEQERAASSNEKGAADQG